MPWGVEIYGLLTRWNPLNVRRPFALPYNGKNVLVVGLGPAGYTLAHFLVNEGFGVVGVDGLKIEPLPEDIVGTDTQPPRPIREWSEIYRELDDRVLEGFGGVSEYGITVRWDKNFLTLLHLTLARRKGLRMYGGIRFGGTMPIEDAWEYGFDHVAVATGAGRPTIIDMKNNLIRGIRKASDFLMALQLTGAFKREALPNLQARLPAVIIGGGLTAIDTATELMAYYPLQVEKTHRRSTRRSSASSKRRVSARCTTPRSSRCWTNTSRTAARSAPSARAPPRRASRPISFRLVRSWGGVTLAYRKRMVDSPAYRLNHEEVIKALEEGIIFTENINPIEAVPDERGALKAVIFKRESKELPAGPGSADHAAGANHARRRGDDPEHHVREGMRGDVPARCEEEVLPAAHCRVRTGDGTVPCPARRERLLHLLRARWEVRHLLRRQPSALRRQRRQGDGVGQGRLPAHPEAVREGAGGARSLRRSRSATRHGSGCASGSTPSSRPSSRTSSA